MSQQHAFGSAPDGGYDFFATAPPVTPAAPALPGPGVAPYGLGAAAAPFGTPVPAAATHPAPAAHARVPAGRGPRPGPVTGAAVITILQGVVCLVAAMGSLYLAHRIRSVGALVGQAEPGMAAMGTSLFQALATAALVMAAVFGGFALLYVLGGVGVLRGSPLVAGLVGGLQLLALVAGAYRTATTGFSTAIAVTMALGALVVALLLAPASRQWLSQR